MNAPVILPDPNGPINTDACLGWLPIFLSSTKPALPGTKINFAFASPDNMPPLPTDNSVVNKIQKNEKENDTLAQALETALEATEQEGPKKSTRSKRHKATGH